MVFEKTMKDNGKKQVVLIVEEDDIATNGPRYRRVQNGLEVEVELLRRQLQALTEQLIKDRKQQHNQHDVAGSATSNRGGGDYEQFFVHIPKQKQE